MMDKRTLTALEKSIKHWEENTKATDPHFPLTSWKSCALCSLFFAGDCEGCPIAEAGHPACSDTPYTDAAESHTAWRVDTGDNKASAAFHKAARAELKFLKSLLPKAKASKP